MPSLLRRPHPKTYRWIPDEADSETCPMDNWKGGAPDWGPPHTDRDYPHDLARKMRDHWDRRAWEWWGY
jgi:hypothetical protein